jgi:hypothetical protein
MRTRARQGIICGYPRNTSDGIYTTYFKDTRSTQNTRHSVFDEWHGLRHDATPEQLKQRADELQARVLDLERRSTPVSAASKAAAPPLTAKAVVSDSYFCANTAQLHQAATQIRQRCEQMHGMRCDAVVNSRVPGKNGRLKNYTKGVTSSTTSA